MASRSSTPAAPQGRKPRRRPADRRDVILRVAAKAFSDSGYHAVRLDDIADAAGISAPALYRHFPNKYALFAETARSLAGALAAATAAVPSSPEDPAGELRGLLGALTAAAVDNRRTGGIYHWEADYLVDDDARYVRTVVVDQHRRIRSVLYACRPDLDGAAADLITAAMTSAVASPATHRTVLAARQIVTLITDAAMSLTDVELPPESTPRIGPAGGLSPTSKREVLLAESIRLFAARGFREVTIDDIARAADLPPSGVYRHFESKAAILQAAFWRASDRVTAMISDALARAATPRQAIVALVTGYCDMCCTNNDILAVYASEIGNIEPRQRTELRAQQRINVEEWAGWLTRDRPELTPVQARFLVQAALNVTMDLTRPRRRPSAERVSSLGLRLLLADHAPRQSDGVQISQ
ncbi:MULTISPECIES: TetR/AcrR family transcriptional regulator [Gordonia]|jgi:AcrR family transcriptional regulator|uniref:TetR/AcrR family transcriptional regulator n=2 Tax=Gordonia TaxID=2053 RepID=A0A9X3I6B8_9ACTN|nr:MULTISPECIES: TetR/AcrR family transcriptional regulator [Gordonia]MCF3937985.1 TetR family transcriptional regulator [Gordonia tangerina]MCX2965910.1 TetR/AcrR family transcriptional regulator [Gordonia aquimaris]